MIKPIFHADAGYLLKRIVELVAPGARVLDVGAGPGSDYQIAIHKALQPDGQLFLLDAHRPYFEHRQVPQDVVEIVGTAERVLPKFKRGAFALALGIDFVEHLDRRAGLDIIDQMRSVADRVVLFVPEGLHPQSRDVYGLGGDSWQTHRATYTAEDFEHLGASYVERWVGFHTAEHPGAPNAIWVEWS